MPNFFENVTKDFKETATIGSFHSTNEQNSFEKIYRDADAYLRTKNIDPKTDINLLIKNPAMMESYKEKLLSQLKSDCERFESEGDTRYASLYEQVSTLFDNSAEALAIESTRVGNLLPIKAIDLPVLIKQHLEIASKDIMQTEVTKDPIIKKHIERRWIVDKETNKRYEYPQCFFNEEWRSIYMAGKGYPIKNTDVELPKFNYNIPQNLTDAVDPTKEKLNYNIKIVEASVTDSKGAGQKHALDMYVNMADGSLLGGNIYDSQTKEMIDVITGRVDFLTGNVTISCANNKVQSVKFAGFLSNTNNERAVTFEMTREEREWKVEDGFRVDAPFTLEDLEDAKALLNMDLYERTYKEINNILSQTEDNTVLKFLDDEYEKYKGVELDPTRFNSFIREQTFNCDATGQTTALPSEYISKELKFHIDRLIIDICDSAKLEDMTFVLYGNPRYISLLDADVNWVRRAGDTVGGVKINYSYGIMNSAGVKIQVVSTMKYPNADQRRLRLIPYPINKEQMTFVNYKHSTHILTSQETGYRDAKKPGGSYTYVVGTIRNAQAALQGIQGSMKLLNTPFILDK